MSRSRPPRKAQPADSDHQIEIAVACHVTPPLPAPYLAGVPQLSDPLSYGSPLSLPDEQLDKQPLLRLELQKQIRDAAKTIRRRRTDYEAARGIVIDPEKPLAD